MVRLVRSFLSAAYYHYVDADDSDADDADAVDVDIAVVLLVLSAATVVGPR